MAEKLGAKPGEGRRARLVVTVNYERIGAALGQHDGDVDGDCGLADAAFDVADCEDHARTPNSR